MIQITEGSLAEVKAEMAETKKAIQSRLKGYRKTCYERGRFIGSKAERKEISRLERVVELYAVSRFIPVRIGSIVINYKLLESFMRKTKDLRLSLEIEGSKVLIHYVGTMDRRTGFLELYDMTEYYVDLKSVPTAETR